MKGRTRQYSHPFVRFKNIHWFALPLPLIVLLFATQARAATNQLEFLPEIGRVLDGRGGLTSRIYLSFSNGTTRVEQGAENAARNRQLHEDLKYDASPDREQWTGVDLEAAPATDELWNATPEQLIAALGDNLAPPLASMQVTPGVWFFRTRDGTYGLMKIEGFARGRSSARAMKLAYKLARPVSPQKTASLNLPLNARLTQFVDGEPSTTGLSTELWEQDASGGMKLRGDMMTTPIFSENDARKLYPIGHVYYLKPVDRFYIQWEDGIAAGTLHYYGPFHGDPAKMLGLSGTNAP